MAPVLLPWLAPVLLPWLAPLLLARTVFATTSPF